MALLAKVERTSLMAGWARITTIGRGASSTGVSALQHGIGRFVASISPFAGKSVTRLSWVHFCLIRNRRYPGIGLQ
jgi:hypothetical protein